MSVEVYGKDLLSGLQSGTLNELLQSLRRLHDPQHFVRTGITAIDSLLDIFCLQNQNVSNGPVKEPSHPNVTDVTLPVVEIVTASPCSGRTELLDFITAHSLLPRSHGGSLLPFREGAVAYFDTDSRFSTTRQRAIATAVLQDVFDNIEGREPLATEELQHIVQSCLCHLHIFSPASTSALLDGLSALRKYLFDRSRHSSSNRPLTAIVISNLSAFLWLDRRASVAEIGPVNTQMSPALLIERFSSLVTLLRSLQAEFPSCAVIAGNWNFASASTGLDSRGQSSAWRPHLPHAWNAYCSIRLVLQRKRVRKFGPEESAAEAMVDQAKRQEAVDKSGYTISIDWHGADRWSQQVKDELLIRHSIFTLEMRIAAGRVQLLESPKSRQ